MTASALRTTSARWPLTRSGAAFILALALGIGASGCGRKAHKALPPAPVPLSMIPSTIPGDHEFPQYTLEEYKQGGERIAAAGSRSLVADGRVWEIRRGQVLVGALQVSTFKPKVDIAKETTRTGIVNLVMPGAVRRIHVENIAVEATKTPDKTLYLWFGDGLFEVLQMKGANIDPEAVLTSVIQFQKPTGRLRIPFDPNNKSSNTGA